MTAFAADLKFPAVAWAWQPVLARLASSWAGWCRARREMQELRTLSDRDLRDLRLSRLDVQAIAKGIRPRG
jgi:uncharacterized protein YjiS (DUF1127 family)